MSSQQKHQANYIGGKSKNYSNLITVNRIEQKVSVVIIKKLYSCGEACSNLVEESGFLRYIEKISCVETDLKALLRPATAWALRSSDQAIYFFRSNILLTTRGSRIQILLQILVAPITFQKNIKQYQLTHLTEPQRLLENPCVRW